MIFERDATVFTFSMHQQHNYPLFKPRGDLDIGLEDGTGDDPLPSALSGALPRVLASTPDLVVYLAGADPYEGDRSAGLHSPRRGWRSAIASSSRLPARWRAAGDGRSPAAMRRTIADTVDIHVNTMAAMLA